MEYDYDENFREAMEDGLERALEGLTLEQLAKLEDNVDDLISTAVSQAIEDSAKGLVERPDWCSYPHCCTAVAIYAKEGGRWLLPARQEPRFLYVPSPPLRHLTGTLCRYAARGVSGAATRLF